MLFNTLSLILINFLSGFIYIMWLAHYLSENKSINKLLVVSFFVYLVVNMFENLIHYTIGKFSKTSGAFGKTGGAFGKTGGAFGKTSGAFGKTGGAFGNSHDGLVPPPEDWLKIIVVMIVFAGLQGILTCYFTKKC